MLKVPFIIIGRGSKSSSSNDIYLTDLLHFISNAVNTMLRKAKRIKWTEEMNKDVLECKKRAFELSSENESLSQHGRKRGYIKLMTEIWIGMGYGHLGLSGQNLRDQAAKLEKICGSATNFATLSNKNLEESQINEAAYATTRASPASNLHMVQHATMGSVSQECSQNNNINSTSIPGILPNYTSVYNPLH